MIISDFGNEQPWTRHSRKLPSVGGEQQVNRSVIKFGLRTQIRINHLPDRSRPIWVNRMDVELRKWHGRENRPGNLRSLAWPSPCSFLDNRSACVDFPDRSSPSITMKAPRLDMVDVEVRRGTRTIVESTKESTQNPKDLLTNGYHRGCFDVWVLRSKDL